MQAPIPLDDDVLDSLRIERPSVITSRRWPARRRLVLAAVGALLLAGTGVALLPRSALVVTTATAVALPGAGSPSILNASGYVTARRKATVSAKTTGRVAAVLVDEGDTVVEGEPLARLEDGAVRSTHLVAQRQLEAARAAVTETRVRLADASRQLDRTERLHVEGIVSDVDRDRIRADAGALRARLDTLESEIRVAESNLAVQEQQLEDLLVRAPFDGIVVSTDAQPGEVVSPVSAGGGFTRTGLVTIVDMTSREIEVDVNEAYINRVHPGQKALAILDAYPDWQVPSHVVATVPTADRLKATVRVRIGFDALDPRILVDMGVKVTFLGDPRAEAPAAQRPAVLLPATAIVADGDRSFVWQLRDERVERTAVQVASPHGEQVEVVAGLGPGDVVALPTAGLREGVRVRVERP